MIENLFMSVGAMKASTSWLYTQLKDHSDIYFPPQKEIHYFSHVRQQCDFESRDNRVRALASYLDQQNGYPGDFVEDNVTDFKWFGRYAAQHEVDDRWYQSLYQDSGTAKYCADFSNLNGCLDEAGWQLVRANTNNIRAIYVLRDPLERVWSHYKFELAWNGLAHEISHEYFKRFQETLDQEWFWKHARYDEIVKNLRSFLANHELRIFYFEDFRRTPREALARVCDFLEIEHQFPAIDNASDKVNSSPDVPIPDEFLVYLADRLQPVYDELDKLGINHVGWRRHEQSLAAISRRSQRVTASDYYSEDPLVLRALIDKYEKELSSLGTMLGSRAEEITSLRQLSQKYEKRILEQDRIISDLNRRAAASDSTMFETHAADYDVAQTAIGSAFSDQIAMVGNEKKFVPAPDDRSDATKNATLIGMSLDSAITPSDGGQLLSSSSVGSAGATGQIVASDIHGPDSGTP
ncbi:conserved hypothetical protein [Burkholderia cenocepacia HI2424]|uniref:Sulfotransferase domain-containing protein n=2 Tax=Burkholderia TaxID=32008 RepID=A0A0H2XMT7_BURO1|nr:conserved hypothetical protein [Burkholderia cenocepacia HI2424]MBJ9881408.1 sulfotransferase domain-containing protein [Burkholderia cenocepacia]PNO75805.1 hypothetical protein DK10_002170 [Burkholderia cenocepacia]QIY41182.1 sulfotransferase domain-containing protein [Burkholderia cenocepacia]